MHRFVLTSALCLAAGCADNIVGAYPDLGLTPPDTGVAADMGVTDGDTDAGNNNAYPVGPYGGARGDVIVNMSFNGYLKDGPSVVDPAVDSYEMGVTLDQIRNIEGYDFVIMNIAAEWCAGCRVEANQLPGLFDGWAARGGYVMSVITEDTASQPARRNNLDSWVANFPINFTMVHDPQMFVIREFGYSTLPLNVIIRLEDMQIIGAIYGEDPAVFDTFSNLLRP